MFQDYKKKDQIGIGLCSFSEEFEELKTTRNIDGNSVGYENTTHVNLDTMPEAHKISTWICL